MSDPTLLPQDISETTMSDEQEELYQRGFQAGIAKAIHMLTTMREIQEPVDAEGWELLSVQSRNLLLTVAKKLAEEFSLPTPTIDLEADRLAIKKAHERWMDR